MKISIEQLAPGVHLGLWKISETPEDIFSLYPFLRQYADELNKRFRNVGRKMEFLCIRALLYEMCHDEQLLISHQPSGKPVLSNGWQLSISHTKGYAVLLLSEQQTVGVDIEYMSTRVERIAPKYIRPDEAAPTILDKMLNWCAKETAYKYFSADDLQFNDMFVTRLPDMLTVKNLKRDVVLPVHYRAETDYVLTYAFESAV